MTQKDGDQGADVEREVPDQGDGAGAGGGDARVDSVALAGDAKDQLVVVGDCVDPVKLIGALRRKVGPAQLVQVGDVKKEEKKPAPAAAAAEAIEYHSHPGYYYYPYHYQWQPEPVSVAYEKHYHAASADGYGYGCARPEQDTCSIM